jgi:hydrogenase maturation protease
MHAATSFPSIAVIGVGNEFRGDDGVGRAVVTRLGDRARRAPLPEGTALCTCDGDAARLISLWEGTYAAVVTDAARARSITQPGRIRRFELPGDSTWSTPRPASSHGLGLAAAVELASVLGRLPRRLIVYTVESAGFELGAGLSSRVQAAVEPLARRLEDEVERLARERRG